MTKHLFRVNADFKDVKADDNAVEKAKIEEKLREMESKAASLSVSDDPVSQHANLHVLDIPYSDTVHGDARIYYGRDTITEWGNWLFTKPGLAEEGSSFMTMMEAIGYQKDIIPHFPIQKAGCSSSGMSSSWFRASLSSSLKRSRGLQKKAAWMCLYTSFPA